MLYCLQYFSLSKHYSASDLSYMASVELFYIISEDKFNILQQCKTEKESIQNDTAENSGDSADAGHNDSRPSPADMASPATNHDISNDGSDTDEGGADPSQGETPGPPMQTTDILKRISGRVRPQARVILHLINTVLKWNKKGEIITQSGDVIHGSDISVIVRNIAQPYKKRHIIGSHYVDNVMRRMNINVKPKKNIEPAAAKKAIKWLRF